MSLSHSPSTATRIATGLLGCLTLAGCTQSVPGEFRLRRTQETQSTGITVTADQKHTTAAPVDLLFVIDNSNSMAPSQTKLKNGLASFAKSYLKPGTDIQIGVITTDAFVANPLWEEWRKTEQGSAKKSPLDKHPLWTETYAKLTDRSFMTTKGLSQLGNLIAQFESQVMKGTGGLSEERGFDSVQEFLETNETGSSEHPLFRKNSYRLVIFLGDEDDQTVIRDEDRKFATPRPLLYGVNYYAGKDQAKADAKLPKHSTIQCPAQTVEGKTLAPKSTCIRAEMLLPVETFKTTLDTFFRQLDGTEATNYMVVAIVPEKLATIEALRAKLSKEVAHERGDRFLKLVSLVGAGSFSMDIGIENYSPILEKIGLVVESHSTKTEFRAEAKYTLERIPEASELLLVTLVSSGVESRLKPSQYTITGNVLEITDEAVLSQLKAGDQLNVQYQPSTVLPAAKK